MGKYYYNVKEYCEDPSIYYSEEDDFQANKIWVGEDIMTTLINKDLIDPLINKFPSFVYDWDDTLFDIKFDEDEYGKAEKEITDLLKHYFPSELEYTAKDITKLIEAARTWSDETIYLDPDEEIKIILDVLKIIHGKEFKLDTWVGSFPGDSCCVIYPVDTREEYLNWLESVVMNNGTEVEYSLHPLDSPDQFRDADTSTLYLTDYSADAAKTVAVELGCSVAEVEEIDNEDD